MPLSIIFCTVLLWIIHFLFSYILINANDWIDDKFIKQSYRCSMKKNKTVFVDKSSTNWKHDDVCLIFLWVWTQLQLLAGDYAEIRRWNNLLYTHQRSFNYNERMILKYNNKSEGSEEKDRLCMWCIMKTRAHKNSMIKHSGLWLYDVDNDRYVLAPDWVSYFINFSQFFVKRFHF